jgi:hypothetical protein
VPAGTWHVICDAIIIQPVDATLELIHRSGGSDVVLATWTQHFDPLPNGMYTAQAYELDVETAAIDRREGDQLVFRYSGSNSTVLMAFIPNGDGDRTGGRIPSLTLPR